MLRGILAVLIIVCLCLDVMGTAGMASSKMTSFAAIIPAAAGFGCLLGQFALLIHWGVLGNEPLSLRLPRAIGLSVFLFYAWCLGLLFADEPPPLQVSVVISLFLVVLFLLLSAPFWLLKLVFHRRILIPGTVAVRNEQFRISHILVWTTAIALLSTFGKFLVGESQAGPDLLPPVGLLWQFGMMVFLIGILMAALSLPLLIATLAPRPNRKAGASIGLALLLGPPLVHAGIYAAMGGTQPTAEDRFYGIVAWYAFSATMSMMIVGPLMIARWHGYRLVNPDEAVMSPFAEPELASDIHVVASNVEGATADFSGR